MAIPRIGRPKALDGKWIFYRYYIEMGKGASFDKIAEYLYKQGVYNSTTGRKYTKSAIYQAAWNWILFNLEEALPILKEYDTKWGIYRTEEEWKNTVRSRAHSYLTKCLLVDFYEKCPEYR